MAAPQLKLGGIILTGGQSRRMATDKYLLPFFHSTLIEHLVVELKKSVEKVILITNEPEKIDFLPEQKYKDIFSVSCALSGLHAGLVHSTYEFNFVLACDLPLFDAGITDLFMEQLEAKTLAVVSQTDRGVESLCGIYSKRCIPLIETMFEENNYALNELLPKLSARIIPSARIESHTHPDVFFNMNTPEEYQEALRLFSRRQN